MFRTKAISKITNAHLADSSSSSYLSIVRLSFSVFALRDRRKKPAPQNTLLHAHTMGSRVRSESQTICDFLRSLLSSTSSRRHRGGIPSGNFSLAVERPRRPRCRLTFSPRHPYLSILRVRSWHVSSTIDWTFLQGQGCGKIPRLNVRGWTRSNLDETVSREKKRDRSVVGSVFRTARGKGRRKVAPNLSVSKGLPISPDTPLERPCAPIRKSAASFEHRSVERPSLFTFLPVVPNINPRQRPIFAAQIPGEVYWTLRESFVNESVSPESPRYGLPPESSSSRTGKALGLVARHCSSHPVTYVRRGECRSRVTTARAESDGVTRSPRGRTRDRPDHSEARAVLDWRDGRLKAAEQGRNPRHRASRHRPPRRW